MADLYQKRLPWKSFYMRTPLVVMTDNHYLDPPPSPPWDTHEGGPWESSLGLHSAMSNAALSAIKLADPVSLYSVGLYNQDPQTHSRHTGAVHPASAMNCVVYWSTSPSHFYKTIAAPWVVPLNLPVPYMALCSCCIHLALRAVDCTWCYDRRPTSSGPECWLWILLSQCCWCWAHVNHQSHTAIVHHYATATFITLHTIYLAVSQVWHFQSRCVIYLPVSQVWHLQSLCVIYLPVSQVTLWGNIHHKYGNLFCEATTFLSTYVKLGIVTRISDIVFTCMCFLPLVVYLYMPERQPLIMANLSHHLVPLRLYNIVWTTLWYTHICKKARQLVQWIVSKCFSLIFIPLYKATSFNKDLLLALLETIKQRQSPQMPLIDLSREVFVSKTMCSDYKHWHKAHLVSEQSQQVTHSLSPDPIDHGLIMVWSWFDYDFIMVWLWFYHDLVMVWLWFDHGLIMDCLW